MMGAKKNWELVDKTKTLRWRCVLDIEGERLIAEIERKPKSKHDVPLFWLTITGHKDGKNTWCFGNVSTSTAKRYALEVFRESFGLEGPKT